MCSESLPKEFVKTTEVLPLSNFGLTTVEEFCKIEHDNQHLEILKRAGLSDEEMKLYQENEAGLLGHHLKIETSILKNKLRSIYKKIKNTQNELASSESNDICQSKSTENIIEQIQKKPITFYPEGHPMNELKQLEENMFGHLKSDILPITKRRKILRRLERKKQRILAQEVTKPVEYKEVATVNKPGSLWDVIDMNSTKDSCVSSRSIKDNIQNKSTSVMGPKKPTMYTIKDNRIVRLEPTNRQNDEYRAVNIVVPENSAEEKLLEGTKMSYDDIKKMDRFKDYEPGIPSKVLYLKNIAPSASQEQLALLFNQFLLDNGQPIDVRLLSGHMRGQAFVTFQNENLAMKALEEVNGTILGGRPIIVQFGRNSNRMQIPENR